MYHTGIIFYELEANLLGRLGLTGKKRSEMYLFMMNTPIAGLVNYFINNCNPFIFRVLIENWMSSRSGL